MQSFSSSTLAACDMCTSAAHYLTSSALIVSVCRGRSLERLSRTGIPTGPSTPLEKFLLLIFSFVKTNSFVKFEVFFFLNVLSILYISFSMNTSLCIMCIKGLLYKNFYICLYRSVFFFFFQFLIYFSLGSKRMQEQ